MVKNYTSTVAASRSVQHIEERLVSHGAMNILKLYENKSLAGVAFILDANGKQLPFKLPARVGNVEKQLRSEIKRPRPGTLHHIKEQAERTAWKLLADWVDIQLSLVELQQVQFLEVFLPYVYDHAKQQTFFEKLEQTGFKQLSFQGGQNNMESPKT
jgi:hypothetical protein